MTYIRWGNSSCPSTGAELVYSGKAGGTHFADSGGGSQRVCLPNDPDYLPGTTGYRGSTFMHGAEYQYESGPQQSILDDNVPCAVCYVPTREASIMIPAKSLCPPTWTREYYGYLTADNDDHVSRSTFECVDVNPEVIPQATSFDASLFYYVFTTCNGLTCPPYEDRRILSCTVCTK